MTMENNDGLNLTPHPPEAYGVKSTDAKRVDSTDMLGNGAELRGREVSAFGHVWTITERNCCGMWDCYRHEMREDGRYRIETSIPCEPVLESHPWHPITLLPNK